MGRLVPEDFGVHGNTTHDVNININVGDTGTAVESIIVTLTICSVLRSWFRRK